ncbi:MAG: 5'(3')-deoxyribonucleotidase [Pricia sp.]
MKTLFVDMDEVMADTYGAHIEIYNKDYDECLDHETCMGSEVWRMVPEERQDSVRNHARNRGFFRDLKPIADSHEVLKELNEKYEVYIASAAMQFPNSLEEKAEWLDEHFPFIPWQRRILCGHKHILKGDILIDDRSYNLENFDGRSLLFTSPHNINTNTFERVDNWQEVADKLL